MIQSGAYGRRYGFLFGCVFLLVAAVLVSAGSVYYRWEEDRITQEKYVHLAAIAEEKERFIFSWLQEKIRDVSRPAKSLFFRQALEDWLQGPEFASKRDVWRARLVMDKEDFGYEDVQILDREGANIILSAKDEPDPLAPETVEAIEKAKLLGVAGLSEPYLCQKGVAHLDAVCPLLNSMGERIAFFLLRSNLSTDLFLRLQAWPTPSLSAEAVLMKAHEDHVLFLNDPRHRPGSALRLKIPLERDHLFSTHVVSGKSGLIVGKDYRGVEVVADLRPVVGTSWFLITKVDKGEIFDELYYRGKVTGLFVLLALVLLAVVFGLWNRHRKARLWKRLYEVERALREAEERYKITLYSIGDAVIVTDERGLIQVMNPVAETLTEWREADAKGRPVSEVFRIVNEERGESVEDPVARVMREGIVVGLGNHTLLISKGGISRPIADSGAPIRDEEGNLLGVVLVFRDQSEERAHQRELARAKREWEEVFEATGQPTMILSPELTILAANKATCELLGLSRGEILGRKCYELFHQSSGPWEGCPCRWLLQGDGPPGPIFAQESVKGRDLIISCTVVRDEEGRPEKIIHTATDVTELRKAQAELAKSQERYKAIFEHALDPITLVDSQRIFLDLNPAALDLFGYTKEGLVGQSTRIVHPSDESYVRFGEVIYGEVSQKGYARGEWTFVTKKGDMVDVELAASVLRGPDGSIIGFLNVLRDVTHRKRLERALVESEAKFRALVENAVEGILVVQDERIRYVNPKARKFFGASEEDIYKAHYLDFTHPEDRPLIEERYKKRALGEEVSPRVVFRIVDKGGNIRWVEGHSTVVNWEQRPAYLVFLHDLTEAKRAEEERSKLEAQFLQAQKMEAVGRLAGGVAHDFNNMLSVIGGYAELVLARLGEEDPLVGPLQEILDAVSRSSELVRQLLAFARKQVISPQVLDLNATIESMLKMLRRLIGEEIELVWMPASRLWPVYMDPAQVDQILANLLVNARDAISGTGKVTIETENVEITESYCKGRPGFVPGRYVLLSISDTGCGMDQETLSRIFEPFFTTKEPGKGTGLGLATVYGIVKQNNGFINVYSEPGKGTTFRIYIPRHEATEGEVIEEEAPSPEVPTGSETVLLVEDERALLKVYTKFLERLGYKVLVAPDPTRAEAIAAKHRGSIELLLTDVVMPKMSGRELWERLKKHRPEIKCLFMSGYTANAIAHHGILEEGLHFISKPFTIEALARKIREVLERG